MEGRHYLLSDQIYLFAKQNRKLVRLYRQVDVIVTDSPLLLSYHYSRNEHILALAMEEMQRARQLHIMLKRVKPYLAVGRFQNEEEARKIDVDLHDMLQVLGIVNHEIVAYEGAMDKIQELISPRT